MEKQQDIIGYVGLGISSIGAIASVITGNVAFASIPLTIGVGCNVLSRKQQNDALVEAHNTQQETIEQLKQQIVESQKQTKEQLLESHRELNDFSERFDESIKTSLQQQKKDLAQEIKRLDLQHQDLHKLVHAIEEVENLSQNIRNEENPALFYYERGVGYEHLGNKEGALQDYNEAIKQDSTLAKAYHKRGIIYLGKGDRQKAVDDLRKAALLYFEQGDIDSYHQAREMSRNVHDLRSSTNGKVKKEVIIGNDLFS